VEFTLECFLSRTHRDFSTCVLSERRIHSHTRRALSAQTQRAQRGGDDSQSRSTLNSHLVKVRWAGIKILIDLKHYSIAPD